MVSQVEWTQQVMNRLPQIIKFPKSSLLNSKNYFAWKPDFLYQFLSCGKEVNSYLEKGIIAVPPGEDQAALVDAYDDLIGQAIALATTPSFFKAISRLRLPGRNLWLHLELKYGTLDHIELIEHIQNLFGASKPNDNRFHESYVRWMALWDIICSSTSALALGPYFFLALLNNDKLNIEMSRQTHDHMEPPQFESAVYSAAKVSGVDTSIHEEEFLSTETILNAEEKTEQSKPDKEKRGRKKSKFTCGRCNKKGHTSSHCKALQKDCPKINGSENWNIESNNETEAWFFSEVKKANDCDDSDDFNFYSEHSAVEANSASSTLVQKLVSPRVETVELTQP